MPRFESLTLTEILSGHDSPETAHVVEDYPYGYHLRCSKRYWIDTATKGAKKGQQRLVTQTTNPKRGDGTSWNKPKRGTYTRLLVLYKDENDHVQGAGLSSYDGLEDTLEYFSLFGHVFTKAQQEEADYVLACRRVGAKITWTIADSNETDEERQARQARTKESISKAFAVEYATIKNGG